MIYLDNNATTPLASEVRTAILPFLDDYFANPSSPHGAGLAAREAVGQARGAVAELIGARPQEVVFTAGATEANHLAILGCLHRDPSRRHLVTTAVEHPSSLMLFRDLERQGYRLSILPVDANGRVAPVDVARVVKEDTALVSMMWANNETGVLMPVTEAAALAKARGALFHTDAVQAAGRVPVDVRHVPVDFLTLSGHKLHAPKGVGALFVRRGVPLRPMIFGHQEQGLRGGTENVPAIVGLGVAARLAVADLAAGTGTAIAALRDHLEAGVLARIPRSRINGGAAPRLPNTANIGFAGTGGQPLPAEALLTWLDEVGIQVSMGAACASAGSEPSHVLIAMGLTPAEAEASLRFSLSRHTTRADIDATLDALPAITARLEA